MTDSKIRRSETQVYWAAWLIIVGLYLANAVRIRARAELPLLDWNIARHIACTLAPFIVLFLVNNFLLMPRLMMRDRHRQYFIGAALLILLIWGVQCLAFREHLDIREHIPGAMAPPPPPDVPRDRPMHSSIPLPLMLDLISDTLVIGCNLAIALMFRQIEERIVKERFLKTHVENQLAYLREQINPHFYLNMLNNIHGMIEIDQARAQRIVIDMSHLMRYILYDSEQDSVALSQELSFIRNYLSLMRIRYPENRVRIRCTLPTDEEARGITIAPLIFPVFVENAFKYGISYQKESFIDIDIRVDHGEIIFICTNSNHSTNSSRTGSQHSGIGLRNARQRLALIYENRATLNIEETPDVYNVTLSIPAYEVKNANNR